MTMPGFSAAAGIYRSPAVYRAGSSGAFVTGNAVAPAISTECIDNVMHASEMTYADAVWWCQGYEGGSGGGDGGGVDAGCTPACSSCRTDDQWETGRSRDCVTSECETYTMPCEYWES
jgi:hypothetical protein